LRQVTHLTDRDLEVLKFLWKWKIATSALIMGRFFTNCSNHTAYKRLLMLEKGGFIEARSDHTGKSYLWMLKKKGFDVIKNLLPDLSEEGFKSENIIHDYLSFWISMSFEKENGNKGITLISEQQLRRFQPDILPAWLPSPKDHRPDGYLRVKSDTEEKLIALELELNVKKKSRYLSSLHYFDMYSDKINNVLWILPSKKSIERLSKIFKDSGVGRRSLYPKENQNYHLFCNLSDFHKSGLDSDVYNLDQKIVSNLQEITGNSHGSDTEPVSYLEAANLAKSPHKSKAYGKSSMSLKDKQTYKSIIF